MPQEHEQDDKHQDHAADENVRDSLHRRMNQGRAIVEGFDLDAGRQLPGVEVLNLPSNLVKDIERLVPPLKQNDAFDNIVALIDADLTQTHPRTHRDFPQSLDENRRPLFFGHHHVFDIRDPVDKAQTTDVVVLRADGQIVASYIGITIGQGGHDLRQIDAIADQSSRIDINVILFGRAPERGDVDDTGNASELPTDLPILNRFQIRERGLAGPSEFIPVDFGYRPPGRQRRRCPRRQLHRTQPIQYFLTIAKDIRIKIKIDLDVAQSKNRKRANICEARRAIECNLDGNRDLAFDFFG